MSKLGFKGRAKVAVIGHQGQEVFSLPWQKNLLLDSGMNRVADVLLCDLFAVAAKGSGDEVTKELVDTANTYSCVAGVVTRTGSARDFTALDAGKWLAPTTDHNAGARITTFDSASQVTLEDDSIAFSNKDIVLYSVQDVGLYEEQGVDAIAADLTKPLGDGTVTASAPCFAADDVGRAIYMVGYDVAFLITAYTSTTEVEVDITIGDVDIVSAEALLYNVRNDELEPSSRTVSYGQATGDNSTTTATNERTFKRTFIFAPEDEDALDSGVITADRAGTTVTASAPIFAGTADDVGKVVAFDDGTESVITGFTSTTVVTVADSGTVASQEFTIYGYHVYEEIGFSDLDEPGNNLNIRLKLAAPVKVLGPTGLYPGQQLKVVYEFVVVVTPHTSTSGNLSPIITGGSAMNANQSGTYAIESFSTSRVDADGGTNNDFALLDPGTAGFLGFSTSSDVLDPLGDKVREANVVFVEMEAEEYTQDTFARRYTGAFGSEEAIGTAWRTLFLGDPDTNIAVFTFRFSNSQTKAAGRVFSMTLTKTWARDLS